MKLLGSPAVTKSNIPSENDEYEMWGFQSGDDSFCDLSELHREVRQAATVFIF
jgi:hypothetical protein